MKLKMIEVNNELHNQIFTSSFELSNYVKEKDIENFKEVDVYLGNYAYNKEYHKRSGGLTTIEKNIIIGAVEDVKTVIDELNNCLFNDDDNQLDEIVRLEMVLEKCHKATSSILGNMDDPKACIDRDTKDALGGLFGV